MREHLSTGCIGMGMVAMALLAACTGVADRGPAPGSTGVEGPENPTLGVTISAGQSELAKGQFVPIQITYTNRGSQPIVMRQNGLAAGGGIPGETITVTRKGQATSYTCSTVDPLGLQKVIGPGESWTRDIRDLRESLMRGGMMINGQIPAAGQRVPTPMTREGEYLIRVAYKPVPGHGGGYTGVTRSGPLEIEIR